ncbi:MAG: PQQ-dependent sugar dehydrogenase [Gemmatimonadales bacterium]
MLAAVGLTRAPQASRGCDPTIRLPDGFCAQVFADELGAARHIAVAENGDVFVALRARRGGAAVGVVALRDTDGDGEADVRARFGDVGGTGIALYGGYLYFGANDRVIRYPLPAGSLEPSGAPETIVAQLPADRSHRDKSITVTMAGELFVSIGAPSNSCQEEDRTSGSPGIDPCPELERRAGIWKFDAEEQGQIQDDGERFATGLRNVVALALHPGTGDLFGVQHGRDQLGQNWPDLFTLEDNADNADKPSEELVKIERGDAFGWPYCYHDPVHGRLVVAPEYGGAFIAFHGSWNRAPLPQGGYNVVFVPFAGDVPSGRWEVFADGFAGAELGPRGAAHRPSGLPQGPDGSLYVTDDRGGRVWRIIYVGDGSG